AYCEHAGATPQCPFPNQYGDNTCKTCTTPGQVAKPDKTGCNWCTLIYGAGYYKVVPEGNELLAKCVKLGDPDFECTKSNHYADNTCKVCTTAGQVAKLDKSGCNWCTTMYGPTSVKVSVPEDPSGASDYCTNS